MSLWQTYRKEIAAVSLILFLKLLLIVLLPVTGDEAYFIKWGTHLSAGYYDHPPMAGWLIYLMGFIDDNIVFYRLFSMLTAIIVAYFIYLFSKRSSSKKKAFYLALIFLASPVDILMSLFTNDIPLILFGTIGAYLFFTAHERGFSLKYAFGSGLFLGLAFLSKYFAVILVFSLFLFALIRYRKRALLPIAVTGAAMLPFIAQNLYYNYSSCWNNIMFNFLARPKVSYHPQMILTFIAYFLYIITPWGLWMLAAKGHFRRDALLGLIVSILSVSLGILLIVSLKNRVGLHWFLLFIPYIYLLFIYLNEDTLKKLFKYNFLFSLLHTIFFLTVLFLPLTLFKNKHFYSSIVYTIESDKVCEHLKPYDDSRLFTFGYTSAAILSYKCHRELHMLFNTSKYARMDDKLVDVKKLNGKDITLFTHHPVKRDMLEKVCKKIETETFEVKKATFHLVTCKAFSYPKYKQHFLDIINRKFYNIPAWLPKGECYFKEQYYKE